MKIIFASDSFKGSLTSHQVNSIEMTVAEAVLGCGDYIALEMADGGEGTLAAIERSVPGYLRVTRNVKNPLGRPVNATFLLRGSEAVVEMAEASGLTLVPEKERNPLNTSSYGTGELIREAVLSGARTIYIGIGGSATNDGGMGAMRALGYRFLTADGMELEGCGRDLSQVAQIDDTAAMAALKDCDFHIMCDVTNPLTGPEGATYTFGPQKGADKETLEELENGMKNYLTVLECYAGKDLGQIEGLGAAGGLGAALYVMLNGQLQSGVDVLLNLADFEAMLEGADAVISGEGKTDWQTLNGKVVCGIAKRCRSHNIPLHVISGYIGEGVEELYELGVTTMTACVEEELPMEEIIAGAEERLRKATLKVLQI